MTDIQGNKLEAGQMVRYADHGVVIGRVEMIINGTHPYLQIRFPNSESVFLNQVAIIKTRLHVDVVERNW